MPATQQTTHRAARRPTIVLAPTERIRQPRICADERAHTTVLDTKLLDPCEVEELRSVTERSAQIGGGRDPRRSAPASSPSAER
jgi:hypothetical protein